jgi:hypothetical protein
MPGAIQSQRPIKVSELVHRRLREVKRTPEELAEALEVPPEYVADLIAGARQLPLPGRTDLYPRMTSFLRLGRNHLELCARAERADVTPARAAEPRAEVRRKLLALCEPKTARALERRRGRRAATELADVLRRLLEVTQGAVRRVLDDQIGLRLTAAQRERSYPVMRFHVLEFLEATPATLTSRHFAEFIEPRVSRWDVDLETGVLRVVLRAQEVRDRSRRPVAGRRATTPGPRPD